jgi:hypothetical protein
VLNTLLWPRVVTYSSSRANNVISLLCWSSVESVDRNIENMARSGRVITTRLTRLSHFKIKGIYEKSNQHCVVT